MGTHFPQQIHSAFYHMRFLESIELEKVAGPPAGSPRLQREKIFISL